MFNVTPKRNRVKSRNAVLRLNLIAKYSLRLSDRARGNMANRCNQWVWATASVAATAGAVNAADAPIAPPSTLAATNWTGFYVGLNFSVTNHHAATADIDGWGAGGLQPLSYVTPFFESNRNKPGFGGQVGYNWQFSNFVVGAEADIEHIGSKTTFVPPNILPAVCGPTCAVSATNDLTWMATFRGRFGLAGPNALLYGTAGVALGDFDNHWGYGSVTATGTAAFNDSQFRVNGVRSGFVYGGGMEYAVFSHATFRLEILQADFGTAKSAPLTGTPFFGGTNTFVTAFANRVTTGRVGLSWRW